MKVVKILIIEDNPVDALCVKDELEETGRLKFEILRVEMLTEAKERLGKGEVDAVVMDLGLPDNPPHIFSVGLSPSELLFRYLARFTSDTFRSLTSYYPPGIFALL